MSFSPIFPGSETKTIICTNSNSAAKGQYIVIHYMEQHITMCAFVSAVLRLMHCTGPQESLCRLLSGRGGGGQSPRGLFREIHE